MNPQQGPYWSALVGEDWPEVDPQQWRDMAAQARAAAKKLRTGYHDGEMAKARKNFDESVQDSAGLQVVRENMAAQHQGTAATADALLATADTFDKFADLVNRNRNTVLDIVEEAMRRIEEAELLDDGSQPAEPQPPQPGVIEPDVEDEPPPPAGPTQAQAIEAIVAEARAQIAEAANIAVEETAAAGQPALVAAAKLAPAQQKPSHTPATNTPLKPTNTNTTLPHSAIAADDHGQAEPDPPQHDSSQQGSGTGGAPMAGFLPMARGMAGMQGQFRQVNTSGPPPPTLDRLDESGTARLQEAVGKAAREAQTPSFVVGEQLNRDLVFARTILAAILAAVWARPLGSQSALELGLAVSVMRGPGGAYSFVTSNEGRGWLPSGVYLPRELALPWNYEGLPARASDAWEGVADPARVLVEFAHAWTPNSGASLTALASTQEISPHLKVAVGNAGVQGGVTVTPGLPNLSAAASGLLDRYALANAVSSSGALDDPAGPPDTTPDMPDEFLEGAVSAAAVALGEPGSSTTIADERVGLAVEAHLRTVPFVGEELERRVGEVANSRELRANMLTALQAGKTVPPQWWEDLSRADFMIETAMDFERVDTARADIGDVRLDQTSAGYLRGLVFERRCNEMVMLLAQPDSAQSRRDLAYAHRQLVRHPVFPPAPTKAAQPTAVRAAVVQAAPNQPPAPPPR